MGERKGAWNDRDVICPYFIAHKDAYIRCEGDVPDTASKIEFSDRDGRPDEAAKTLHYRIFCCRKWRNCEHAQAVRRKYEDA